MLNVNNVSLQFGGRILFDEANITFTKGNCYGIIGANGAGKSTFMKVLASEIQPTGGDVTLEKNVRMSVLAQNQNAYDDCTVLETVLAGHKRLTEIIKQKEALYAKEDFTDADGELAGELESEFADLDGWEAEANAESLLNSIKVDSDLFYMMMADVEPKIKVKILLAQALFGNPDVLILDEPTNNLDPKTIRWLEDFLIDFENTIIIVSHNRHFLNRVCTHICDIDFGKVNTFLGNYDFWYETNQLMQRQAKELNKKRESRAKELQDFIARFSANASKSKSATSRKKELEKLQLEDIKPSSRKYPFVDFKFEREIGNDVLVVNDLTKKGYFENLSFILRKGDKIFIDVEKSTTASMLFDILAGLEEADSGSFRWGITINKGYMPQNFESYFENCDLSLVEWLGQFSKEQNQEFLRGWLGRMLFSGEEALKKAKVLSGGEKVRCMLSKCMLEQSNFLMMDEPTNHLDLESITSLNKGMTNFKGGMMFVSHDHELCNTVATRILAIGENGLTFDREIPYDEYVEMK